MHSKQVNITIIVAYAPPEYAETKLIDGFYNDFIAVHNDIPQDDMRKLTGDFNARVSSDSSRWQGTVGKQSLHDSTNDNGKRFMDFCALHEYIIGGTLFEHKNIHKATWLSPKGDFTSQIDHICINKRWKKCLLDVRSQRGADINTSHYLVRGKLRLKLSSLKKSKNISPPNLDALRSGEKVAEYQQQLNHCSAKNRNVENSDIDADWEVIKSVYKSAAKTTLGKRPPKKKDQRLSTESKALIEERNRVKRLAPSVNTRNKYISLNKQVKKSVKHDDNNWAVRMAKQ